MAGALHKERLVRSAQAEQDGQGCPDRMPWQKRQECPGRAGGAGVPGLSRMGKGCARRPTDRDKRNFTTSNSCGGIGCPLCFQYLIL
eukprot:scaffold104165_cov18-Tisochrysis_lutea.AAC.1